MEDTQGVVRINVLGLLWCPVLTRQAGDAWFARVDGVEAWADVEASGEDMHAAVANLRHKLDAELMVRAVQ